MPYLTDEEIASGRFDDYLKNDYQKLYPDEHKKSFMTNPTYRKRFVSDSEKTAAQNSMNAPAEDLSGRTLKDIVSDTGIGLARGGIGLGDAAIGLANLPTGGQFGKFIEDTTGYKSGEVSKSLADYYSHEQKEANRKVAEAKGFFGTVGAALQNPSTIVQSVIESAPAMVAGGVIGRGLLAAAPKIGSLAAGAIGEGTVQAGGMAEGVRQTNESGLLTGKQALQSIGSGIGTGVFGLVGGRIAKKLGVNDVDSWLAGGRPVGTKITKEITDVAKSSIKDQPGVIQRIISGGISEGVFEELPQSIQEQIWMNAATDKPLTEGIGEAGAMGMLAGIGMGAGGNVFSPTQADTTEPPAPEVSLPDQLKEINDKIARVSDLDMGLASAKELNNLYAQADEITKQIQDEDTTKKPVEDKKTVALQDLKQQITELAQIPEPTVGQVRQLDLLEEEYAELNQEYTNEAQARNQNEVDDRQAMYDNLFSDENIRKVETAGGAAKAAKDLNYVPRSGRPTDIITQKGVPYQKREYLENYINSLPNKDDYEVTEVSLQQFTKNLLTANQSKKAFLVEELNNATNQADRIGLLQNLNTVQDEIDTLTEYKANLDSDAFNTSYPGQVGYVARLTDDAIDSKRPEVIAEKEAQDIADEDQAFVDTELNIRQQQKIKKTQTEYNGIKNDSTKTESEKQELLKPLEQFLDQALPKQNKVALAAQKTQSLINRLQEGTFRPIDQKDLNAAMAELKNEYKLLAAEEKDVKKSADILTKQKQIVVLNKQLKEIEKTEDLTTRPEVENKINSLQQQDKLSKKQTLELKKLQNQIKKDDDRKNKIASINRQMSTIFTDTDRAMSRRFQNDFAIQRVMGDDTAQTEIPEAAINVAPVETSRSPVEQQLEPDEPIQDVPTETTDIPADPTTIIPATSDEDLANVEDIPADDISTDAPTDINTDIKEKRVILNQLFKDFQAITDKEKRAEVRQQYLNLSAEVQKLEIQQAETEKPQLEVRENKVPGQGMELKDIKEIYPNQKVSQDADGKISVYFKNGKGVTFQSIQDVGDGYIQFAIDTNQMDKDGKILGITVGDKVLLDANFADKVTLWHENKHVLDNLGMITKEDNSVLTKEFNDLRKTGKLDFTLSTHEDPVQRMKENLANTFAQIMTQRENYRDKPLGTFIQKVMDFFNQLFAFGKQTLSGLASEVESGKIYERTTNGQTYQTTVPQAEVAANTFYSQLKKVVDQKFSKGTGEQIKTQVQAWANKGEFKQEELDWTGLIPWLENQKGKIIKQEVLDYLDNNKVIIEDVVKSDKIQYDNLSTKELYDFLKKVDMTEDFTGVESERNEILETVKEYASSGEESYTHNTKFSAYQLPGGKNYKELLLTLPVKKTDSAQKTVKEYILQLSEKYGAPGDEFGATRSQWTEEEKKEVSRLSRRSNKETVRGSADVYKSAHWDEPNVLAHVRTSEREVDGKKVLHIEEIQSDWAQDKRKDKDVPKAPFINKTASWSMLAMKKMVRYAAENGFDSIAWTQGKEQADRYDLAKQVDSIDVWKDDEGYNIVARKEGNPEGIDVNDKAISIDKVADYIGKDLAAKVKADPDNYHTFEGLDLVVGGEGMVGFYDKILPAEVNKFFGKKAWGKPKIGEIEIQDGIKLHSLNLTSEMKSKALREGMPQFEVRNEETAPNRDISQAEYDRVFKQKKNIWTKIKQVVRMNKAELSLLADQVGGSISTRLKIINPKLSAKVRELDYRTNTRIAKQLGTVLPLLDKAKKMSPQDKSAWDWARKQGDVNRINQLTSKYNMTADYVNSRQMLNQIYKDGIDVGFEMGNIVEYWPRILKDQEGFLQKTKGISQRPEFTDALKAQADKMGITVDAMDPIMRADIISNVILGVHAGIGGPGNTRSRVFNQIPAEFAEFYMDSDAAMMQYIYSMSKKIEARRFFGKVPEKITKAKQKLRSDETRLRNYNELLKTIQEAGQTDDKLVEKITNITDDIKLMNGIVEKYKYQRDFTENIGSYISELLANEQIQPSDEKTVRQILDARFHERGTTGRVNAYKNLAYIDTMGSPLSAITQVGDLAFAYYVGGLTPTGILRTTKNVINAARNKSNITKEDLGIERIAQEFADSDSLSNAVSKVFRAVGLEYMDSIGKEALINTSFENYKDKAKQDSVSLKKEIRHIFGKETDQVVTDLLGNNPTDNVKLLVYNRLLDFQPVALSEMPEKYLNSGNGRIFYMLKTYTIKQFDVFRRDVFHNIRYGDKAQKLNGIKNMMKLGALLTLANAGADELKDLITGKDTKFEDHVIENFLTLGGASKYTKMQIRNEGVGSAFLQQILPPMKFINSLSKDVTGDVSDGLRSVDSVPIVGKLYYWHYGRGAENRPSQIEKDFKEIKADSNKFKEKLKNSDDKKAFMYANIDQFRQMKIVDKYQRILNKNTALTNKLKDMPQTPNVQKRISQLQQQRVKVYNSFFNNKTN